MSDNATDERQTLGQSVRSQGRYGYGTTVTNSTVTRKCPFKTSPLSFIKHEVSSSDTLMGIALKYGVTVEQIKRENRMWTNDSLFLRKHLLIPVTSDNEGVLSEEASVVGLSESEHSAVDAEIPPDKPSSSTDVSGMAFFNKYDNTIAELKSNVSRMEQNARFLEGMENPNPLAAFRRTSSSERQRSISFEDPDSPVLVIRSNTQSRKIQSSLDCARKANDELFEL